jgi:hypothetical protein
MSQGYVPGPCQVFTGTDTANPQADNSPGLEFLGWSEEGVDIRFVAAYEDIVSDFGGPMVPVDTQFMGEHAFISMTLNKFNEPILLKVMGRRFGGSSTPGQIEMGGLGALMVAQQYSFQVLLNAPYASIHAYQSATAIKCYWFKACWLHDEFSRRMSVRLSRPACVFHAVPLWQQQSGDPLPYANLYSTSPPAGADFPPVD